MRCVRLVLASVLAAGGLAALAPPAQAVTVIPHSRAIVTLNATGMPGFQTTQQRFGDAGTFTMTIGSNVGGVRLAFPASNYLNTWFIEFAPPAGQSFHRGRYPVVTHDPGPGQAYGEIAISSDDEGFLGDIDVLDWVPGPNDLPSRFDIVFRDGTKEPGRDGYFGEVRLNEPGEGAVHLGSRHIAWPSTAVGSTPITATEWLKNDSTTAVTIGAPTFSGANAGDWRVTRNGCAAALAARATCSLVLGYSPSAGGPRIASLRLPVGGKVQSVSLTGEAPLGTSDWTFSGTDFVSGGTTHAFPNGPYVMTAWLDAARNFVWTVSTPYVDWYDPRVRMNVSGGGPLAVGTHSTVGTADVSPSQYREDTFGFGRGCGSYAGSMTVHAFTLGADGTPSMANIDYTQRCLDEQDPTKVMTARLLWQYRTDTTPPKAPSAIGMTGSTVHWTKSVSGDAVESVARLVPGTGQDATATSGYPLSAGSATWATMPALVSGETYTIAVFAVDATGNVSAPVTRTVLG